MIYFITGNEGKFKEAKAIMPEIEQLIIDLPEIQELGRMRRMAMAQKTSVRQLASSVRTM